MIRCIKTIGDAIAYEPISPAHSTSVIAAMYGWKGLISAVFNRASA